MITAQRPVLDPPPDLAPGLERAFAFVPEERSGPVQVEGSLPASLRGTYYLNGPARFARAGLRYRHWLDGDGMVCALRFDDAGESGAHLTARFVRSAKWTAEEEAGRPLFRAFGTAFPGDRLVRGVALESPVNVSVVPWRDTLLAFGEQGLPYELDPVTLETRGLYNFGGTLNPVSPLAAHAKVDPTNGELLDFGVSFASARPLLNLYRYSAEGALLYRRRLPLPFPCSLHDFALSPRHAVFYLAPYVLDVERLLREGSTLMESLVWRPELGTRLLVVDRQTGEAVADLPIGDRYCLHTINAFEEGDLLAVDVVELDRPVYDQYEVVPDLFTSVSPGRPVRLLVDLRGGSLVERRELGPTEAPDFPAIAPCRTGLPTEDVWMLDISTAGRPGRKFFDRLVHLPAGGTPDVWQAPPGVYLGGEPAFAPLAGEERGAVLCQRFDAVANESAFLVFDAFGVAAGPRAVLPLESPLHLGFHAVFVPE
ncbi:MAG TPA: carotenoid oxygenase family protein [Thermoanaerobaculia bacterium]|nr:carotenoid oxygenase family protein [Thermoanaerobaculia bacterium]